LSQKGNKVVCYL